MSDRPRAKGQSETFRCRLLQHFQAGFGLQVCSVVKNNLKKAPPFAGSYFPSVHAMLCMKKGLSVSHLLACCLPPSPIHCCILHIPPFSTGQEKKQKRNRSKGEDIRSVGIWGNDWWPCENCYWGQAPSTRPNKHTVSPLPHMGIFDD